ncbi:hypothetical protein D3C86_1951740 [compost metagenome]
MADDVVPVRVVGVGASATQSPAIIDQKLGRGKRRVGPFSGRLEKCTVFLEHKQPARDSGENLRHEFRNDVGQFILILARLNSMHHLED